MCQEGSCVDLPDVVVPSGATVRVAADDGAGLDDVVLRDADLGDLLPSDGELALFRSGERNAESLIAYYQWGSDPHATTDEAIEAGLWIDGSYGPSGDDAVRLWRDDESGLWLWDAGR